MKSTSVADDAKKAGHAKHVGDGTNPMDAVTSATNAVDDVMGAVEDATSAVRDATNAMEDARMVEQGLTNSGSTFLDRPPVELAFGTSGLRGLVTDMTDVEVFINTVGFLRFLKAECLVQPGCGVAVGRDLRHVDPKSGLESSPRIARAVAAAIEHAGHFALDCGAVPTPALAHYATVHARDELGGAMPAVMVTGSHIPADRNGVKFYRPDGEVLKADEAKILDAVRSVRREIYALCGDSNPFDGRGMLKTPFVGSGLKSPFLGRKGSIETASGVYVDRYRRLFRDLRPLVGSKVVVYEHSAVGRDLIVKLLEALGAEVVRVGRSEVFVAVDTEDVSPEEEAHYAELVAEHRADALVSTDGDGDRPLVVDEAGRFHRGDVLGAVVAEWLGADFAAVPVSTSDAVERYFVRLRTMEIVPTRIGSPYVIEAMNDASRRGWKKIVAWEANGGFLTGSDFTVFGTVLKALPTRDAMLPILAALVSARSTGVKLSALFAKLPNRSTRAGLIDDFPRDRALGIISRLTPRVENLREVEMEIGDGGGRGRGGVCRLLDGSATERGEADAEVARVREAIDRAFSSVAGLGPVVRVNVVDGVRIFFSGGDIVHLRASGNAPQFRVYVVSDTQSRADTVLSACLRAKDGAVARLEES